MTDVSVIIPVYKVEPWLSACLDSVLAQTLQSIEVICVDDASPDACPQILDAYAEKDARVQVIHLAENRGQGHGRNLGLYRAAGKYVYFLDSDDMIESDAMERLFREAEKERLDGILFDSRALFEDKVLAKRCASYPAVRKGTYPKNAAAGPELFAAFVGQREWTCYVQRQFWRRSFLLEEKIDFPVRVEHEDEVFAFKAVLAAKRVLYRPWPLFIRRYRADSVMTSPPMPKNFYGYFMDYCYMDRFAHERGYSGFAAAREGTAGTSGKDRAAGGKSSAADPVQAAIDRNLARIYEKLVRYYRDLAPEYDLGSWFRTPEEKNLFYFFASSQKAWMHYGMLSGGLLARARAHRHLYIYGAGVLADQVFRALEMRGFVIDGFLVTNREGNPDALHGRPVLELNRFHPEEDTLVIAAVTAGYKDEIFAALDARGIGHEYYDAE